jgi:asparagine synthase (glutamine-hydrolysing)
VPEAFHSLLGDVVWFCDEPFAVSSAFALFSLARLTSKQAKVVLTGDGSDEIFAGYSRHQFRRRGTLLRHLTSNALRARAFNALSWGAAHTPSALLFSKPVNKSISVVAQLAEPEGAYYARLMSASSPEMLQGLLDPEVRLSAGHFSERYAHKLQAHMDDATDRGADWINARLYGEFKTSLVDEMLMKVDRMSMASGIEARVPFLDHKVVEWAFRLPGATKVDGTVGKTVLRTAARNKGIPDAIIDRAKWGFNVPLAPWFRGPLLQPLRETLLSRGFRESGLFQKGAVERLLKDHETGRADHSNRLFALLVWQQWRERFAV